MMFADAKGVQPDLAGGVLANDGRSLVWIRVRTEFVAEHSQAPAYPLIPTSVPASEGKESGRPRTVKPRDIAAVA